MWGLQHKADMWAKVSMKSRHNIVKEKEKATPALISHAIGEDSLTAFKVGFTGYQFFNPSEHNVDSIFFKASAECQKFNCERSSSIFKSKFFMRHVKTFRERFYL